MLSPGPGGAKERSAGSSVFRSPGGVVGVCEMGEAPGACALGEGDRAEADGRGGGCLPFSGHSAP